MTISSIRDDSPELATTIGSPFRIWPGRDGSGIAAEILIGPVDQLNRKSERRVDRFALNVDGLQMLQKRTDLDTTAYSSDSVGNVVAEAGRDRNRHNG